jgi:Eukaryotic phosphomannomutase
MLSSSLSARTLAATQLISITDFSVLVAVMLCIQGWDKTFCLRFLDETAYDEVHFFGDKTFEVCTAATAAIRGNTASVLLYSTSSGSLQPCMHK